MSSSSWRIRILRNSKPNSRAKEALSFFEKIFRRPRGACPWASKLRLILQGIFYTIFSDENKSIICDVYADTVIMSFAEVLFSFTAGGVLYVLTELIYKKHSHISMFFAGGFCFMLLHALFTFRPMPLILKCISGMFIITAVEFLTGAAVNIKMKRNVWDYSKRKCNLYGQICLKYSLLWGFLTVPVSFLSEFIRKLFV